MPKAYIQLGASGSSPSICPARATGCVESYALFILILILIFLFIFILILITIVIKIIPNINLNFQSIGKVNQGRGAHNSYK